MSFGRLERNQGDAPMSDINMTPLIDVMLVLLVIFMLTAPLMTSSLKLNLPRTEGTQKQPPDPKAIKLSLLPSGDLMVDGQPSTLPALAERLLPIKGSQTEIHLRADKAVPYGKVAEVLGVLQKAELHRIAFVADPAAAP
ncbi:MAG TPA: biopolymer transporter ExbD, partial [Aquabacterium sp.]|nr:biopolymer transporter ExbD [Aquabacterium sp.]